MPEFSRLRDYLHRQKEMQVGRVRRREEEGEELAHQPPSEIPLESICEEEKEMEEEEEEEEEKEGKVEQKGEVDRSLMVPQWNPSQPHW